MNTKVLFLSSVELIKQYELFELDAYVSGVASDEIMEKSSSEHNKWKDHQKRNMSPILRVELKQGASTERIGR